MEKLKTCRISDLEIMKTVALKVSNIMPGFCGVTIGGSRMNGLQDSESDAEMYFYTHEGAPKIELLDECLNNLGAEHKRCDSFLWENKMPWGPHSFFILDGLYFEIGYRNIETYRSRIIDYKKGNVKSIEDCHDLGLGYFPSALSSSVAHEIPFYNCNEELMKLKSIAEHFDSNLLNSLKEEYFDTAISLLDGKLVAASNREDYYFYESISGRIMRCLMIMAFAINNEDFPGDKWNKQLLLKTNWKDAQMFLDLLKEHIQFVANSRNEFLEKREYLVEASKLVKKGLE